MVMEPPDACHQKLIQLRLFECLGKSPGEVRQPLSHRRIRDAIVGERSPSPEASALVWEPSRQTDILGVPGIQSDEESPIVPLVDTERMLA